MAYLFFDLSVWKVYQICDLGDAVLVEDALFGYDLEHSLEHLDCLQHHLRISLLLVAVLRGQHWLTEPHELQLLLLEVLSKLILI